MGTDTNTENLDVVIRAVYDSVVEELTDSMGEAIRDSLYDFEARIMKAVHSEVEALIGRHESEINSARESYLTKLEQLVKDQPKRKTRTEKTVVYSQVTGRPEKIIEETSEE